MDKARAAAIQVVFEVNERDAYSNIALANVLRNKKLSDIDRRFCTELVYGTVKAGQSIDWIIEKYVTRSLKQIDPKILAILRVGMYQIFFLDRVPNSAVVNESVEIAKKISVGASKFVNAVLRSTVREPHKAKFPSNDSAESIALSMYHPLWLVKRWIEQFGINETKNICAADNEQPPLTLRVNLLKTTKDEVLKVLEERGVKAESSKHAAEAVVCRNLGALDDFDLLKKGFCQVQDESSMIATHMLAPQPGEFIIDCCAAPGGKATHIAEMMNNTGRVVAIDIYDHKIKQIKDNATRLGIKIIEPLLLDATTVGDKFNGVADRVLVDAPCSGLGVLRRKADLRWKKKPDELAALPKLQLKILKSAAKSVKVGGVLLYSTCTLEKAENTSVINKFLQSNKQFELESDKTLLPHVDHTDGFFIAKMKRIS